jgi:hypothetical protein
MHNTINEALHVWQTLTVTLCVHYERQQMAPNMSLPVFSMLVLQPFTSSKHQKMLVPVHKPHR